MKTALTEAYITVAAKPFGHTMLHMTVLLGWLEACDHRNTSEAVCYDGVTHALLCFCTQMNHTVIKITLQSPLLSEPKPYHIAQRYADSSYFSLIVNVMKFYFD